MKKYLFFSLTLLFAVITASAQNTVSKTPPSFQSKNSFIQKSQTYKTEMKEDVEKLRAEDMEYIKDGHPLRVAIGIPLNLELNTEKTQWFSLPAGEKVWKQSISSEGANGLILSFEELYIPEGGELYIYTADRTQLKIFTSETNPMGGVYASGVLFQDEVVLEYVQPAKSNSEEAIIKISDVGYLYRKKSALADDMSCYINIACEEGADWMAQANGVVGMWMNIKEDNIRNWYICSGSLINNVRQDKTPYILTANHCIEGADATTYSTMEFDFFKESTSSNCKDTSDESTLTKTLTGASLVADIPMNKASDGTLLKLKSSIPDSWEVYYNGWDARGIAASSGVSIHHPDAMVKKISTFTKALISVGNVNMGGGEYTGANAHWKVNWAKTTNGQSVTYGGSSGSPLFNENGHIVGTLTGGSSYCDDPNEADYYGKFSYHWDQYTDANQHFKKYLDPDNTGILVLDGYDPHAFDFENNPTAKPAKNVSKNGFTANWDALKDATRYYLDVYQIEADLSKTYLEGYHSKNVGNLTSVSISGLEPETQYYYVVRGGAGLSSVSGNSNEISVETSEASLDYYSVLATEASFIQANSFQANWDLLKNATSYSLNVYQKTGGDNEKSETVDFTENKIPSDWKTNASAFYGSQSTGYYGTSAPSLKLDNSGKYLESPVYDGTIKSLEFWYRGASATASSYLTISAFNGSAWSEIKKIQPLEINKGVNVIIGSDELPECTAIKFTYTKDKGNLALDDIKITSGDGLTINYVSGYEALNVGNISSRVVSGLEEETEYYYTVTASDGTYTSKISNEISVVTNNATGIDENTINSSIQIDNEDIIINSNSPTNLAVYNITGQLLLSQTMHQGELRLAKANFHSGVYFVKIGNDTHKILIK